MTESKTCTKCNETKPLDDFSIRVASTGRRKSRCKACTSLAAREAEKRKPKPTEKACRACGETKPLDDFNVQSNGRFGRAPRCRECVQTARQSGKVAKKATLRVTSPGPAKRWYVAESDGATFLIHNLVGDEVIVDFDDETARWSCSACSRRTCAHIELAGRRLPADLATRLGARVASKRTTALNTGAAQKVAPVPDDAERLAASAERRAKRAQEHDASHAVGTSEVTVRKMTPEDIERLRLARERKAGTYQPSLGWAHFAG